MKELISYVKENIILFIFFFVYLVIGLIIFKDYSISFDENLHRDNGFISLQYILNKFSISFDLEKVFGEIPDIKNDWRKVYGVVFDLPLAFFEIIFGIKDSRSIYLLRHLFTFLIFFSSTVCFYKLINYHFKNKYLGIVGVLFLILSPRIFAQSFYNSRDIVFLSFFIFSIYFSIKALNLKTIKYIILASFFCALSSGSRVLGCYIPLLTVFFYYLNNDKKKFNISTLKFSLYYLSLFFIFLYLFWPYLWENPLINFVASLSEFSTYWYDPYVLYLGNYINANHVPWHYFFVWFFISTPPLFLLFIIVGCVYVIKIFLVNFISIENDKEILLWRNDQEMNELFILFVFLIPIFLVISLNSTLYTGWRHLFFIYPPLVFLGVKAINILTYHFTKYGKEIISVLLLIQIGFITYFLIQSHPIQSVYFNYLSKNIITNRFYYDYWGLGNSYTLEKLISNEIYSKPLRIATSSLTDLNKTKLILKKNLRDKFIFLGTDKSNADFIFTNYYYDAPPYTDDKFIIPKGYQSIIKLEIGGLIINEMFKKK